MARLNLKFLSKLCIITDPKFNVLRRVNICCFKLSKLLGLFKKGVQVIDGVVSNHVNIVSTAEVQDQFFLTL